MQCNLFAKIVRRRGDAGSSGGGGKADRCRTWNSTLMQRCFAGEEKGDEPPTDGGHGIQPLCKDVSQEKRRGTSRRQMEDMEFNPFAKMFRRRKTEGGVSGGDSGWRTWDAALLQRFCAGDVTEKPEVAPMPTEGRHGMQPFCQDCSQEVRWSSLRRRLQRRQEKDMDCSAFAEIDRRSFEEGFSSSRCSRRTCIAMLLMRFIAGASQGKAQIAAAAPADRGHARQPFG